MSDKECASMNDCEYRREKQRREDAALDAAIAWHKAGAKIRVRKEQAIHRAVEACLEMR